MRFAAIFLAIAAPAFAQMSGKQVGSAMTPVQLIGDPNTASNYASTLPLSDGRSLSGLSALVAQTPVILQNASGTYDVMRSAPGTTGVLSVNTEGTKATYSAATIAFTPVATATDFECIIGSGTKTVRVLRLQISGIASSATSVDVQLIKRSTANSGSTPVALTAVPNDSNDASATATVNTYTSSNPTTGTAVGTVRGAKLNLGATGAAGAIVWDFTRNNDQGIVLRGTSQSLCFNWNGAAVPSGTSLDFDNEWSEE